MTDAHRPRFALGLLVVDVLVVGALVAGCSSPAPAPEQPSSTPGEASTPSPSPSRTAAATDPLTGGTLSSNEVFAVKIENTAAARPQVGLGAADIVVVEEVEARITRMIAIYHTSFPSKVGPVRSARNTDVQYLPMFGKPGLVYSGANTKVQRQIRKASVVPIERSDRDRSRPAPHNVMVNLAALAKKHKVGTARDIGLRFAADDPQWADAAPAKQGSARVGGDTMGFRSGKDGWTITWNGKPYPGNQRADNVVVLRVKNHKDSDTTSSISVVSETVGSGRASVYRDGRRIDGTWTRAKTSAPMYLKADGKDITLTPGKTWILLSAR